MRRCRICKVPLDGLLGNIANRLFNVKTSIKSSNLCNKCEDKEIRPIKAEPKGKYRCQICDREIDEAVALSHVKAEEYILSLILKDHPQWKHDKTTCKECIDYYRQLVKKSEI